MRRASGAYPAHGPATAKTWRPRMRTCAPSGSPLPSAHQPATIKKPAPPEQGPAKPAVFAHHPLAPRPHQRPLPHHTASGGNTSQTGRHRPTWPSAHASHFLRAANRQARASRMRCRRWQPPQPRLVTPLQLAWPTLHRDLRRQLFSSPPCAARRPELKQPQRQPQSATTLAGAAMTAIALKQRSRGCT